MNKYDNLDELIGKLHELVPNVRRGGWLLWVYYMYAGCFGIPVGANMFRQTFLNEALKEMVTLKGDKNETVTIEDVRKVVTDVNLWYRDKAYNKLQQQHVANAGQPDGGYFTKSS